MKYLEVLLCISLYLLHQNMSEELEYSSNNSAGVPGSLLKLEQNRVSPSGTALKKKTLGHTFLNYLSEVIMQTRIK